MILLPLFRFSLFVHLSDISSLFSLFWLTFNGSGFQPSFQFSLCNFINLHSLTENETSADPKVYFPSFCFLDQCCNYGPSVTISGPPGTRVDSACVGLGSAQFPLLAPCFPLSSEHPHPHIGKEKIQGSWGSCEVSIKALNQSLIISQLTSRSKIQVSQRFNTCAPRRIARHQMLSVTGHFFSKSIHRIFSQIHFLPTKKQDSQILVPLGIEYERQKRAQQSLSGR